MQGGIAQVGIDQEHALAQLGEVLRQGQRGRRLALTRRGAGDQETLGNAAVSGKLQGSPDGTVGFRKARAWILEGRSRRQRRLQFGDDAQY